MLVNIYSGEEYRDIPNRCQLHELGRGHKSTAGVNSVDWETKLYLLGVFGTYDIMKFVELYLQGCKSQTSLCIQEMA